MGRIVSEGYHVIKHDGIFTASSFLNEEKHHNLYIGLNNNRVQLFKPSIIYVSGDITRECYKTAFSKTPVSETPYPFLYGKANILCRVDGEVAIVPLVHLDSICCHFDNLVAVDLNVVGSYKVFNDDIDVADDITSVTLTQDKESPYNAVFVLKYKCKESDLNVVNLQDSSITVTANHVLMWTPSLDVYRSRYDAVFSCVCSDLVYKFSGTGKIIISTGSPI